MNEFDSLMGLEPETADAELNGFFSKAFKRIKRSVKKVTKPVLKVAKSAVKSHIGKIALTAATGFAGGTLLASGLKAFGTVQRARGFLNTAKSAIKRRLPIPYKIARSVNRARLNQRRAAQRVRSIPRKPRVDYTRQCRPSVRRSNGRVIKYHIDEYGACSAYEYKRASDTRPFRKLITAAALSRGRGIKRRTPVRFSSANRAALQRYYKARSKRRAAERTAKRIGTRNANRVLNSGERASSLITNKSYTDRLKKAAAILRGRGYTYAQIRDMYLQSRTYRNAAIPATTMVVKDALYKDLIGRGIPSSEARIVAETYAPQIAAEAVGKVQASAASGDLKKLLPFAIPAATFLLFKS